MNEVTRYDLTEDVSTGEVDITPVPARMQGRYVTFEDYEALAQQLNATINSLNNAEEALKVAGIEADTVQSGVMELVDKLRIKQNHIKLRDTYIEELEHRIESSEVDNRNYSDLLSYHIDRQAKAEAGLEKAEVDISQLIGERDYAEDSISKMFEVVMDEKPEWSNWFIYDDAIDVVADKIQSLKKGIQDD